MNPQPARPERETLRDPAAARLLARAAEIDASRAAGTPLADLRAAAGEAGISERASDRALAELPAGPARVTDAHSGSGGAAGHRWLVATIGALAVAAALAWRVGSGSPLDAGVPMVEESIALRCLAPGDAAELVRPHLRLASNTVVFAPANAPHVLTVRGTRAQLEHVKAVLDEYEAAGAPACGPATSAT